MTTIRRERAIRGGPTYPDHYHVWMSFADEPDRAWLEREAQEHGGRLVLHLGLDSMSDFLVVETVP